MKVYVLVKKDEIDPDIIVGVYKEENLAIRESPNQYYVIEEFEVIEK